MSTPTTITIPMPRAKTVLTMPVLRSFALYGLTFAAHYSVRGAEYTVSEMSTGAAVAHGDTLTGTIRIAREILEKAGEPLVHAKVGKVRPDVRRFRSVTIDLIDPEPIIVSGMRYEPLVRMRKYDLHEWATARVLWYEHTITARRVGSRKLITLYEDEDGVLHREQPSKITYLYPKKEVAA